MHLVQPLVVAAAVAAAMLAIPRDRFSALKPGERMVVQYVNQGCFASYRARFTFAPAAEGLKYTAVSKDWHFGQTRTGVLTPAQVAQLDAFIDGYTRLPGAADCSRRVRVTLTRFVHGIPLSRTTYANASCRVADGDLTLVDLLPR